MGHYSCLVVIDSADDIDAAVDAAMKPFNEETSPDGFWDWYQIGGRWTGLLDGYDPEKDIDNIESCRLCAGTGTRPDMKVSNGCNGCQGRGVSVKWPTQWKRHAGDIMAVSDVPDDITTYAVIQSDGTPDLSGNGLCKESEKGKFAVVVDYHC